MTTFEEFVGYCDTVICEERDYEKYVKENLSDFIQFYSGSWKELFEAVLSLNSSDIDLEKFAKEGQLLKLKIASKIGLQLTSEIANIAALNYQLSILQFLKESDIYVSLPFEIKLIKQPNFRLLKFLDTNSLFYKPEKVAEELVREGRDQLLNGLTIRNLISPNVNQITNKITLWEKYEKELNKRFQYDRTIDFPLFPKDLPNKFKEADPEGGKNVEWIIKSYINNGIRFYEDLLTQVKPAIEDWIYLKNNNYIVKSDNPFNDYTTLVNICGLQGCEMKRQGKMFGHPGLYEIMKPFDNILEKRREITIQLDEKDYKEIWNDNNFRVIQPLTEKGSCYYGQGTKWCTAAKNNNQFKNYNEQGSLYIIIPKNPTYVGEKYQLHIETDSLMNELDNEVSIRQLLNRHPNIINIPAVKFYIDLKDSIKNNNTEKVITLSQQLPTNQALKYALRKKIYFLIEYLLKSKLKINEENTRMSEELLNEEAINGNINIVKIFSSLSPPIIPDKETIQDIAKEGYLEILMYIYSIIENNKTKYPSLGYSKTTGNPLFNEYLAAHAAFANKIEILKWLYSLNPPIKLHSWAIQKLMTSNKLSILEWLAEVDPKILLDEMGLYFAITESKIDVLNLILKINPEFILNKKMADIAKRNNKQEVLQWFESHGITPN